ncbi:MFS transporter [Streptomyces melanosporofaciens]|uniref:MFS transporter n=1 Tax=Streptomyces melanosporofaciens TaxID=67327 RepID=UPI000B86EE0E|nr:MFS transporter [Streptomyces melanosporofaciens]
MIGRAVAGAAHGTVFALGAPVAASLVPRDKSGSAISLMFMGLTVAMVVGVPAGTAMGTAIGWRATFIAVAALGLAAAIAVWALIPNAPAGQGVRLREQLSLLSHRSLALTYAITALGFGATFAVFTYLELAHRPRRIHLDSGDLGTGAVRRGHRDREPDRRPSLRPSRHGVRHPHRADRADRFAERPSRDPGPPVPGRGQCCRLGRVRARHSAKPPPWAGRPYEVVRSVDPSVSACPAPAAPWWPERPRMRLGGSSALDS